MSEFGIVLPQKVACMRQSVGAHLEDLPRYGNLCISDLLAHADQLDARIADYDKAIAKAAREDARSKRLMEHRGIGPVTASAFLAGIGNRHDFKNGRQVAAWIGVVPGQYSSGGKTRLGRITKAGDGYLSSLLVMGARAILSGLGDKQDGFSRWARSLVERRGTGGPWSPLPPRTHPARSILEVRGWRGRYFTAARSFGSSRASPDAL